MKTKTKPKTKRRRRVAPVTIAFHSDFMDANAHPAIDVKRYSCPDVPGAPEDIRSRAYEATMEQFWRGVRDLAHAHGYSGAFSEGRSGGWCVPFEQYQAGKLAKFDRWPGQGGAIGTRTEGYPVYVDAEDTKQRARFVGFRAAVERLLAGSRAAFIAYCRELAAEAATSPKAGCGKPMRNPAEHSNGGFPMANEWKVGQEVICNGYPGHISRICDGQLAGMVEVRLERGEVCVSANDIGLLARPRRVTPTRPRPV